MIQYVNKKGDGGYSLVVMLGIVILNLLIASVLSSGLAFLLRGKVAEIELMRILQVVQSIAIFIIPSIIGVRLFYENSYSQCFGSKRALGLPSIILSMLIIICSAPLISWATYINMNLPVPQWMEGFWALLQDAETEALDITRRFLSGSTFNDYAANFLIMALLPAVGEEWLFRGMIQPLTARATKNMDVAILITAVLFSALHFQFMTFFPRVILGVILGYLFYLGGSLWLSIAAHFANNLVALVLYKYYQHWQLGDGVDPLAPVTTSPDVIHILLSLAVVVVGLYFIYRLKHYYSAG